MKISIFLIVLTFGVILQNVESAKILAIFPTVSKSHWIFGSKLMKELANAGHEVTVLSPFPLKNPPKGYRDIELTGVIKQFESLVDTIQDNHKKTVLENVIQIYDIGIDITNSTLSHPNVIELINSDEKFDLVFLEIFLNEAMLGFGHRFKAPIVTMSTLGATKWINDLLGSPKPLSYVPHLFLDLTDKMSFRERLLNTFVSVLENAIMYFSYTPKQTEIYERTFKGPKPTLEDMKRNSVSLGLLNNHFSLSFPQPYLPNLIEVGGMHVNTKPTPLPKDIQDFIESSPNGVIYFSMGSNLKPSLLKQDRMTSIYNVLKSLPQKILWKWDKPELFNPADNILISSWFPQDDILAHSNVKLFITHGGLLSCTESIYHGVPVIGIPIFGDQKMNMARVSQVGWGIGVDFDNITETSIRWAIEEILNKPNYRIKAKTISTQFRDQPMTPLETAKFWVEYVIRHNGAPQLHSQSQELGFIQYHMLDVFGTILAAILLVLYILVKIIRAILCVVGCLCGSKKSERSTTNNKKVQ